MALLSFDAGKLKLSVKVGTLETYKPTQKIKKLDKNINDLREKIEIYLKELCKADDIKEIEKILASDIELQKKFQEYLKCEYNPKIEKFLEEIEKINYKLCSGYKEYKENLKP